MRRGSTPTVTVSTMPASVWPPAPRMAARVGHVLVRSSTRAGPSLGLTTDRLQTTAGPSAVEAMGNELW